MPIRVQTVREKCEPDYVRAKPLRRGAEREVKTCWRTAFRDFGPEGSMYRTFAAYCEADVHDRYSGRALRDKQRLSPDKRSKAQPPPDFGWVEAVRGEAVNRELGDKLHDYHKGIEDDLPKSPPQSYEF
jgi:hypothetical protein